MGYDVGKYDSEMDERIHEVVLTGFATATAGSIPEYGWVADLVVFSPEEREEFDGLRAAIVVEDDYGFVRVEKFTLEEAGRLAWLPYEAAEMEGVE